MNVPLTACPACRQSVSPNASACPHCGQPIQAAKQGSETARLLCILWALLFTVPAGIGIIAAFVYGVPVAQAGEQVSDFRPMSLILGALALLIGWLPYLSWRSRRQSGSQ